MEGINYFYYNVLYRPAVGRYLAFDAESDSDMDAKLEDGQTEYYQSTENYPEGYVDLLADNNYSVINVTPLYGRFQRDRWDIQDNPDIYYDKVLRRGYAEEKMVAIYAIGNSGWFDAKYRRESRANSVDQQFTGLENVKFTMLSDVVNEESLFSFSPYCYSAKDKSVIKMDLPINLLANWAINPPSPDCQKDASGNYILGGANGDCLDKNYAYTPKKNLCAPLGKGYTPVHAGWTYFDKMWPMYWTMGNVSNTSADTSVLQRFVSYRIEAYDIGNYPEPDVNEVQFLNKDGNAYYRAVLAKSTLDIQDQNALVAWKDCKAAGNDDNTCIATITFTEEGAEAANQAMGLMIDENGDCVAIAESEEAEEDAAELQCVKEGEQRFKSRDAFRDYLSDKYSRLSPSYRLVKSAGMLKNYEDDAMAEGAEGYSRLVIMETTIDQLNSFAADQLGFAVVYASHY